MAFSRAHRKAGRTGLASQLSIAITVAMLLGMAVLLVTSALLQKAYFSRELSHYLDDEMNKLLITVAEPVVTGDYATIEKMLIHGVKSVHIEAITFTDNSGGKIAVNDMPVPLHAPEFFVRLVALPELIKEDAITIGGRRYGTIRLQLTTTPTINYMWSMLATSTQVLLLALALVIAITLAIVRYRLRPLVGLADGARRIGSGDYTIRIPEEGSAETVQTIRAFNRMADELLQTLDDLKQSRDRYSLLYNQTPVLLHSIDRSGSLVEVNDYWLKVMGYDRAEVIGRHVTDFYAEASRKYALEVTHPAFFRDGICTNVPYQFVKKNGQTADVLLSATGERDASGAVVRSMAVIVDVTERKRAERLIREKEDQYRLLFEAANDGIFIQDADGFIDCNRKGAEMYGLPREKIIGRPPSAFAPERQPDGRLSSEVAEEKVRVAMAGVPQVFEWQPLRADGSPFDVEVTLSQLALGGRMCLQAIVRDISERKRLEQERLRTQKLEAVGILAGGIAHDFNNLLQGVFGYISLAKLNRHDEIKSLSALEQAEKALHLTVKLTNQLLTFSKGGKPVKKAMELLPVVESAARFALSGSRSGYSLNAEAGLPPVDADEGQIGQVIHNIVLNADQAMPEGGRVEIGLRKIHAPADDFPHTLAPGDYVEMAIKDNGIGIAEDYLGKIFDPYFTTKEKGSGLGLATSYSIIANHNGLIDVKSSIAKGTVFRIYLPAAAAEHGGASDPAAEEAAPVRTARVLVMDDEQVIRDVARELLQALGHEAEFADEGKVVIEKYRTALSAARPFDLVILDLTIRGGMGGVETLKRLREIDPAVKAVVSSGYSDTDNLSDYQEIGFSAFLKKPYTAEDLQRVLNTLLRR